MHFKLVSHCVLFELITPTLHWARDLVGWGTEPVDKKTAKKEGNRKE